MDEHLDKELGLDAMLAFEGDGKVPEDFNEAGPDGLALLFRICFALQHCTTRSPTALTQQPYS